jgi:peroxiredoxin Q/BCP
MIMRLSAPSDAIEFSAQNIYGERVRLSDFKGKRVMLSFFRDAACPFCNLRLYELTHQYTAWKKGGLVVIAVFSSPSDQVQAFVARNPRPFHMISDPELAIYRRYGVEHSTTALFKALIFKMPRIIGGVKTGGRPSKNPNIRLVPADFLIDEQGQVAETWYGRDTSDHIPLERVQAFIDQGKAQSAAVSVAEEALAAAQEQLTVVEEKYAAVSARCAKLEAQVRSLAHMNALQKQLLSAYKKEAEPLQNTVASTV